MLEVVVASSLLVILLLGLATTLTSSMSVDALTREKVAATHKAVAVMEEVASVDWDLLLARDGTTFPVSITSEGATFALLPGGGRPEPGLVRVQDAGQPDLRVVDVSVVFYSRGTRSDASVALRCFIAKH